MYCDRLGRSLFILIAGALSFAPVASVRADETDPAYGYCKQAPDSRALFYDCACVADNAASAREALNDRTLVTNERTVERRQSTIDDLRERIKTEENPKRVTGYERKIANLERMIADLRTRPDPASHDSASVIRILDETYTCRSLSGMQTYSNNLCQAANRTEDEGAKDSECGCASERVASDWVEGKINPKMSSISSATVRALSACKKG